MSEIADNCAGVKLVLVALKCDLRERHNENEEGEIHEPGSEKSYIDYDTGLAVAKRIQALRYLGGVCNRCGMTELTAFEECSAKRNRGVNEAFTEAARVALSVKGPSTSSGSKCTLM